MIEGAARWRTGSRCRRSGQRNWRRL